MKIFIAFISIIWIILVIITVAINVLDYNFSSVEGIAAAIGTIIGGILLGIPSYFGMKYSNGGQSSERINATNGTNMNQLNENKFPEATITGVVLILVTIIAIVVQNNSTFSENSLNQFIAISTTISLILRIGITIWVVNISKVLKKDQLGWGFFAFFLPSISLIFIGQSSERKTATILNHVDNIPIKSAASKSFVDNSKTFKEKKDILIDLKDNGILSSIEYQAKFDLILKQEDSLKDQINTKKIQKLVNERIEPYLNKLSDLTRAKILSEDEFDQKKEELINQYTKKISAELYHENNTEVNIYDNEKKELIHRVKKWRNKWALNSNDISEIHSLIEQFILFDDDYFENIKSFQDKYGFDLVTELRTISDSYAFSENILAPLIKAGIVENKYPYEIRKIRSVLYPENITEANNFKKISKSNLTSAEIMGVTKLEKKLPKYHFILKSKITNNITSYSKSDLHNIIENGDMANYFLIVS